MNIVFMGDLHWRERKPIKRTDENYLSTMTSKLLWIYNTAIKYNAIIIKPGDVFDSFTSSYDTIRKLAILIQQTKLSSNLKDIYCVAGQHDQRYHTHSLNNTPLGLLCELNVMQMLSGYPRIVEDEKNTILLYGTSYGGTIPEKLVLDFDKPPIHILVTHTMVSDKDYWNGHVAYNPARTFLRESPFDVIVCGDNHNAFFLEAGSRSLINCGSVMRSRIDQFYHIPTIAVYDTENMEFQKLEIPYKPPEEVFNLENSEQEEKPLLLSYDTKKYIDILHQAERLELELDFVKILMEMAKQDEVDVLDLLRMIIQKSVKGEQPDG